MSKPQQEQGGKIETWVRASDRLPIHKAHWITHKFGTYDNQFPVRMKGRYAMADIFDEAPKNSPSPKFMLKFEGKEHYDDQFSEIEWLDEYTSTTPPASQPSYVPDTEDKPVPEIPKMDFELAAKSDVAALEYGKQKEFTILNECGDIVDDYNIVAALTEAHEDGQSWMYRHMQEEIAALREGSRQWQDDCSIAREQRDAFKRERDEALSLLSEQKIITAKLEQQLGWAAVKVALSKTPKTKDNG